MDPEDDHDDFWLAEHSEEEPIGTLDITERAGGEAVELQVFEGDVVLIEAADKAGPWSSQFGPHWVGVSGPGRSESVRFSSDRLEVLMHAARALGVQVELADCYWQ